MSKSKSTKKKGLGRGLGALISDTPAAKEEVAEVKETKSAKEADQPKTTSDAPPSNGLRVIKHSTITPNPKQPRTYMDPIKLQELSDSIKEHGLIQPIIVTSNGDDTYTLIAGERRWRASGLAGLQEVPVVVKEATTQEMLELAIIENVQRADLNPLEEALAYRQLMDEYDLTQEQVAVRMGKSRPAVANLVRLLNLPDNVKQAVVDGTISGAHARAILPLATTQAQTMALNSIINLNLNVRQTEALVRKLLSAKKPAGKARTSLPAEWAEVERQFRQKLGTKVDIQKGAKGGKIVVHYYSDEEFNTLYDMMIGTD